MREDEATKKREAQGKQKEKEGISKGGGLLFTHVHCVYIIVRHRFRGSYVI